MLNRNHKIMAAGIASSFLLANQPNLTTVILVEGGAILGATMPDVDNHFSWCKHRGFSHTIFAWILITIICQILFQNLPLTFGLSIGYLSHLILDSLSIAGIRWCAPFTVSKYDSKYGIVLGFTPSGHPIHHHFNYHGYRVGGELENIISTITLILTVIANLYLITNAA